MKAVSLEYIEVFQYRPRQHATLGYRSRVFFIGMEACAANTNARLTAPSCYLAGEFFWHTFRGNSAAAPSSAVVGLGIDLTGSIRLACIHRPFT